MIKDYSMESDERYKNSKYIDCLKKIITHYNNMTGIFTLLSLNERLKIAEPLSKSISMICDLIIKEKNNE